MFSIICVYLFTSSYCRTIHKKIYVYNIVSKYLRILINIIICYCCKRLLSYYYKTQKSNTYISTNKGYILNLTLT